LSWTKLTDSTTTSKAKSLEIYIREFLKKRRC